jgi:hypothetical protein
MSSAKSLKCWTFMLVNLERGRVSARRCTFLEGRLARPNRTVNRQVNEDLWATLG